MSWFPWVSRTAYDMVLAWNEELRTKNDAWEDHIKRIDRREHGLTELPVEKKEPADVAIPSNILRIINRFGNEQTRKGMRNDVLIARNRGGKAWSEIEAELEASVS